MHTHGLLRAIAKPTWLHVRDLVRSPSYRALHRFAWRLRRQQRAQTMAVRFAGRTVQYCDGPSFLSAWDEIFVHRIYEVAPAHRSPLLVDAGANIGLAALYWKWRLGDFRYVGFEPDPKIAAICRANLTEWKIAGTLHECALAASEGQTGFQADGADAGRIVAAGDRLATHVVRTARLSTYLDAEVDLLKIDIEGAELEVLREAESRLSVVRNIFVEAHSRPHCPQALPGILRLLEGAGFRCHVQVGYEPAQPFIRRDPSPGGFDSLVNVFGVREGKD